MPCQPFNAITDAGIHAYIIRGLSAKVYPETHSMAVSRSDGAMLAIGPTADYRCERIPVVLTPEYRTPIR